MLDYELLKLIWWGLIGVLLIGFAITDGFDMGVSSLLPFVAKSDEERRVVINTVGAHWEGNQVWLVTAGGALFAAWPLVYAMAFSGFYLAMLLVLAALFLRPVGFDYRSKIADPRWRNSWDWALFMGGTVPPLVFGIAFGNLLQGVPFEFGELMRPMYTGSFWSLLNPFALLAGVLSLAMFSLHGAVWLQLRADAEVQQRAKALIPWLVVVVIAVFTVCGIWLLWGLTGYQLQTAPSAITTPLTKQVLMQSDAWWQHYQQTPWLAAVPLVTIVSALKVALFSRYNKAGWAFLASCGVLAGVILTAACTLFPFVMPSSSMPDHSLTLWDAVSSHKTLNLMFYVAMLFVPIILCYTLWSYYKLWGRITKQFIQQHSHSSY